MLYNGTREPASLIKLVMGLEHQAFAWVGLEATQSWANSRGAGDLQLQSALMPIESLALLVEYSKSPLPAGRSSVGL